MKEGGTFIQATFGSHFMFSLNLKDDVVITAGTYIMMIDPIWDKSISFDKDYRNVLIDIYAPV